MIYTLDRSGLNGALITPTSKDIEEILKKHSGQYEFLGHDNFLLPLFYFELPPPNDSIRGITWVPAHKEA